MMNATTKLTKEGTMAQIKMIGKHAYRSVGLTELRKGDMKTRLSIYDAMKDLYIHDAVYEDSYLAQGSPRFEGFAMISFWHNTKVPYDASFGESEEIMEYDGEAWELARMPVNLVDVFGVVKRLG